MANHDFLTEFIELYQQHPYLWNKKDPQYHNVNKRQAAYNVLVNKFKEQDNNATIKTVKAKINNLRSAYNKERKKVNDATKSGAGSGDIYEPSLWYYDLLMFLNDTQDVRGGRNTMDNTTNGDDKDPENTEDSLSSADDRAQDGEDNTTEETTNRSPNEESNSQSEESRLITKNSSQSVPRPTNTKPSGIQVKRPSSSSTQVLQLVADRLTKNDHKKEDMHTAFGKHISAELRNMAPEMVPFVKKNINDTIFERQMRSLNKTSAIITQPLPQGRLWSVQQQQSRQLVNSWDVQRDSTPDLSPAEGSMASYFSQYSDI